MRIGVTGHQELADPTSWEWVEKAMRERLSAERQPVVGVSSLAVGADQLFASVVLQLNGELEAIIPFRGYEQSFQTAEALKHYRRLIACASVTEILPRVGSDEECYLKAGHTVARRSDVILAIWDGQPSAGLGGTADIVAFARSIGRAVIHIDPCARRVR